MRSLLEWLKFIGLTILVGIGWCVNALVQLVLLWVYMALVGLFFVIMIGGTCYVIDLI